MKVASVVMVVVAGMVVSLASQAGARAVVVDQVALALKETFSSLNSKRSEWFENYSAMNNMTKAANTQLQELRMVSKMALPLMWYVYRMTVSKQKHYYEKLIEMEAHSLPFHAAVDVTQLKLGLNFYSEFTLLLQNYRDFQVQISKDGRAIFFLTINFNERRAVMGYEQIAHMQVVKHDEHDYQRIEKVVLDGDNFPEIPLNQPFRINIQVMSDCTVASFLLRNLDLMIPMPLPEKHFWCTRDYAYGNDFTFDIDTLNGENQKNQQHDSQDEQDSSEEMEQASQEEDSHEVEASEIQIVSAVVYSGYIFS